MEKIIELLKEVRTELKKVRWPSRTQTLKLTTIVVASSLLLAFFVGIVDYIFAKAIALLV